MNRLDLSIAIGVKLIQNDECWTSLEIDKILLGRVEEGFFVSYDGQARKLYDEDFLDSYYQEKENGEVFLSKAYIFPINVIDLCDAYSANPDFLIGKKFNKIVHKYKAEIEKYEHYAIYGNSTLSGEANKDLLKRLNLDQEDVKLYNIGAFNNTVPYLFDYSLDYFTAYKQKRFAPPNVKVKKLGQKENA